MPDGRAESVRMPTGYSPTDLAMMRRCVALSALAVRRNELPFACVVCRDGEVVAEATNRVVQNGDVTQHAELIAIGAAQRALGRSDLSDCTIYCSVEPCPMCAFPIRETRIGRVVYAISSPMMGGLSKWNVLGDHEISNVMPQVFGDIPEVSAGLLYSEAASVWRNWSPVVWFGIRFRGCLAEAPQEGAYRVVQPGAPQRGLWRRLIAATAGLLLRNRRGAPTPAPAQQPQQDAV
jgi:tRNA(adenine34) deaminase